MNKNKRKIWRRFTILLQTSIAFKLIAIFVLVFFLSAFVVYLIERNQNPQFGSYFESLYWTMVTVATVGYGDKVPITTPGRLVAMLIMVFGVASLGTVTGQIASFLMERQMKAEKGLLSYEKEKNHFIICGWKREMNNVLYEVLGNNPGCDPGSIVLVNRASPDEVSKVQNDPRLRGIRYVNGDYIEERDLLRAGITQAERVLVMADYLDEGDLQQIDSKTVMAVMTIKNLNKKAYVCAEILDTKYEKYLQLSHCDEILLSRDFSRSMLASASLGLGISHVVRALLSKERGAGMTTRDVPASFLGKTYNDLKAYFDAQKKEMLIGLLENTGNILTRKKEALREAQKNPNITEIIPELKTVKALSANVPVLNPPGGYSIKKFTKAICIVGSTVES
ncbi:MAG: ion channel [Chitinivibrionales bacterium]